MKNEINLEQFPKEILTDHKIFHRENGKLSGLGFVFAEDDPFCGIDLDKCRDAESGIIKADAQKHIEALSSYTEISPSEKGVHVILKGKKKGEKARNGKMSMLN